MAETVILGGARTPFGKFGGALKDTSAVTLGALAIKSALERSGLDNTEIEHVVMGMVLQAGAGQIPSRQAVHAAGLPWEVTTETLNKVCASGMRSVTLGDQIIRAGDAEVIIAGGMESMDNAPYLMKTVRSGLRMGHGQMLDAILADGLICAFEDVHMIQHAHKTAVEHDISREMQDEWAVRSHQFAARAQGAGYFAEEIVPVPVKVRKEELLIAKDEAIRGDSTLEQLAKLRPVYTDSPSITAGNAPGINNGAAALVLASKNAAARLGQKALATIVGHSCVGIQAKDFAMTPSVAISKLLNKHSLSVKDIAAFEINEAFSAVALANIKVLGLDAERVNVNGGAVALGHPIGASGARIILSLVNQLRRQGGGLGVAAICSGAAQGDAVLVRVE